MKNTMIKKGRGEMGHTISENKGMRDSAKKSVKKRIRMRKKMRKKKKVRKKRENNH